MNVLVSTAATSKNINRLKLVVNGTVRSKSGRHTVIRNMIAEGPRPDFLPSEYVWIPSDDVKISHRHLHGLEYALTCTDVDFAIFCDDDVVIDIDAFVEQASVKQNVPSLWTTEPGMYADAIINECVKKHASKIMPNTREANLYMGFCTSVVNKAFLDVLRKNREALDAIWNVSKELYDDKFCGDLQISMIAHLINADHIKGQVNNGTCWPAMQASSLLSTTGKYWHVHGFRESAYISQESLQSLLGGHPLNPKDMNEILFRELTLGIKAKEWSDIPLRLHFYFRPWTTRWSRQDIMNHADQTMLICDNGTKSSGVVKWEYGIQCTWEACDYGLRIKPASGPHIRMMWTSKENAIVGMHEDFNGHMRDCMLYGLWADKTINK